jgi:hypothetical protein
MSAAARDDDRAAVLNERKDQQTDADDDSPVLSSADILSMLSPETRSALQQHQQAQESSNKTTKSASPHPSLPLSTAPQRWRRSVPSSALLLWFSLDEDFGLSQFWYTPEFSAQMAHEAVTLGGRRAADQDDSAAEPAAITIVCIACPSIYQSIISLQSCNVRCFLLEYDLRFAVYSPFFVHYDLHAPTAGLPEALLHRADFILADPPYLNADTLSLVMQTVELLRRHDGDGCRVIVNTGAVLRDKLRRVWGLSACRVQVRHRVQIMNPFCCYADYDAKGLGGWEEDEEQQTKTW